jgi:hypothetical protein
MPIVRNLRRANVATTAAAAATGVLTVPAVIKFIIWEAGVWVAVYLISTNEDIQKWFEIWIYTALWVRVAEAMEVGADTIVNGKSAIQRAIGTPQAPGRETAVRARTLAGLDPKLLAKGTADEIEDAAAGANGNRNQSNAARGAGNATPGGRANQGSTNSTDWMLPPELR